jgi:hypothetical protein
MGHHLCTQPGIARLGVLDLALDVGGGEDVVLDQQLAQGLFEQQGFRPVVRVLFDWRVRIGVVVMMRMGMCHDGAPWIGQASGSSQCW